jgi:Siphovirus Gp157
MAAPIELNAHRRPTEEPARPRRTLYELSAEWSENVAGLMELDPADAERWEIFSSSLDELEPAIAAKCEAIVCLIRELERLAEAQRSEAQRIDLRANANRDRARRLRAYVTQQLRAAVLERVETTRFTLTLRPSPETIEVVDPGALPEEFRVTRTVVTPDREAIRRHYRTTGELPPGVEITRADHLDIR